MQMVRMGDMALDFHPLVMWLMVWFSRSDCVQIIAHCMGFGGSGMNGPGLISYLKKANPNDISDVNCFFLIHFYAEIVFSHSSHFVDLSTAQFTSSLRDINSLFSTSGATYSRLHVVQRNSHLTYIASPVYLIIPVELQIFSPLASFEVLQCSRPCICSLRITNKLVSQSIDAT